MWYVRAGWGGCSDLMDTEKHPYSSIRGRNFVSTDACNMPKPERGVGTWLTLLLALFSHF